jgi:nitroreductase / dihydropteridine reductase
MDNTQNFQQTIKQIDNSLSTRYTSKMFTKNSTVDNDKYQSILKSANLAPSSFGLQGFRIIEITDEETKKAIAPIGFNQAQFTTCDKILIWAIETNMDTSLDGYIDRVIRTKRQDEEGAQSFKVFIKGFLDNMKSSGSSIEDWNAKQAYISLGFALYTAALLGVESAPMEGFDKAGLDKLLDLESKGLKSLVVMTIGTGSDEDENKTNPKVRKSQDEMILNIKI